MEIWNFSLERIVERPVLGWGFDGSRYLAENFFGTDEAGRSILPLHPHNGPLQIMLELGAVGAVIVLALLWLIAIQMNNLSRRTRECGQALLVAALAIGCVAFGQWQNWWLALIFSVAPFGATYGHPSSAEWRESTTIGPARQIVLARSLTILAVSSAVY